LISLQSQSNSCPGLWLNGFNLSNCNVILWINLHNLTYDHELSPVQQVRVPSL